MKTKDKQISYRIYIDLSSCPCCESKNIYTVVLEGYKGCDDCGSDWAY